MGTDLLRTPLHAEHLRLGAKMVPFGGWDMPLHYTPGILEEHVAVRTRAGLFDVCHMGRYEFSGPGAVAFANSLIANNLAKLEPGRLLYAAVCADDGGVLDDVTVYRRTDTVWFVVNASNRAKIWSWIERCRPEWKGAAVTVRDRSSELAQIALQGPRAQAIVGSSAGDDLDPVGYYHFLETTLFGVPALVSRNGYTGEDGFEIYFAAEQGPALWRSVLEAGQREGIVPTGLGCRDTLRLEMGYCLYGNELSTETSPLEAGIGWTVKLKQEEPFHGQAALQAERDRGSRRILVGFDVPGKRLPRHGQSILRPGGGANSESAEIVGQVTSGGFSPSLQRGIGLGLVHPSCTEIGSELEVDVRGARVPVTVVERPFYKNASHR